MKKNFLYGLAIVGVSLTLTLLLAGCEGKQPGGIIDRAGISEPPPEGEPIGAPRLRTVYVPAYSHLPQSGKSRPIMLSILLSVRNVDTSAIITLTHVDYFDTSGHRVRRYLDAPRKLRPLETAEFIVDTVDDAGGSGANFLVYWEGPSDAHSLLTECVMSGQMLAGYVSFTSRGVELDRRPDPKDFIADESTPTPDTAL